VVRAAHASVVFALCVGATALGHAALYLRARWRAAREPSSCPNADDAERAGVARLVLAETIASIWLLAASLRPRRLPLGDPDTARHVVLLVAPGWLPPRALTVLGGRLARGAALVGVTRVPRRPRARALARAAACADALGRACPAAPLSVVCFGAAARSAGTLAALLRRGVLRHLLLLAPPAGADAAADPRTVTLRALDDAVCGHAPDDARAATITLRGVGHLSLLVAPHVAEVIRDACRPDDAEAPRGVR
jgi:hypothetical protein